MQLICVIGCNGTGKTTVINAAKMYPHCGTIEVGQILRAKYPPSYFAGQSSPAHTAAEAFDIFLNGLGDAYKSGKQFCFTDGQPRDLTQCDEIMQRFPKAVYMHMVAPDAVRLARLNGRDTDPERRKLSEARFITDAVSSYAALSSLLLARKEVHTFTLPHLTLDDMEHHEEPEGQITPEQQLADNIEELAKEAVDEMLNLDRLS